MTATASATGWQRFYDAHAEDANFFSMPPGSWGHFKRDYRNYRVAQWLENHGYRGGGFLDAGCGSGLASIVAAQNGFKVTAIDISDLKLSQLRQAVADRGLDRRISVVHGDISNLGGHGAAFDVINSQEVIEHIEDPGPVVREFARVLRPGGIAVISTPYREKLRHQTCPGCGLQFHPAGHFHSFDERSMEGLFGDSFRLVGFFTIHLPGAWRLRRSLRFPYSAIAAFERAMERGGQRGTAAVFFLQRA